MKKPNTGSECNTGIEKHTKACIEPCEKTTF